MIEKIKENWEKILLILKEEHEISNISSSIIGEMLKAMPKGISARTVAAWL